ncbi:MAG: class I adenylate-forming enzyme family protein [Halocynthiibacter sp.]
MNLALWLQRVAQKHGHRGALFLGDKQVADYGMFFAKAAHIAGALRARGVQPGDRVGIFMKNTPEYLVVFYGIWIAGAAAIPINAKLHEKEAAWILENAKASLCFVTQSLAQGLTDIAPCPVIAVEGPDFEAMLQHPSIEVADRGDHDLAWLFYTSGTTGRPKGVQITHGMLSVMSLAYFADVDEVHAEDAILYAAPMSHAAGIYNMMHVLKGARHVCPPSGGFDATEVLDLAENMGPVHMFMAPTMVRFLIDTAKAENRKGEGLRTVIYAGGPMYLADITEAVDWFGPKFAQVYGQGECPMAITALTRVDVMDRSHPNWQSRLKSVGRAQSIVEVKIGDETGAKCAVGEIGEIMVKGPIVMPGYWKNPEATENTIKDGWLLTGDMGSMDADGYVTLQDRSKDLIISGGSNIYPREVEEALLTHSDVREVSVIGRPSPEWGEDVVAFVVSDSPIDPAILDAHCLSQIARFKRPKTYYQIEDLPKNNYGKVLKTALRDRLKTLANKGH